MASTNQSPQYQSAEAMFLQAQTNEERLRWLEEMIRECPKHKSAESMLANLKTRRKKLLEKIEASKKSGRSSGKPGIKKEELQAVIVGFTNSGKSSLLSELTNVKPEIAPYEFTTKHPLVGMMKYSGTNIQLIEIPAIGSEYYDSGLVNSADVILIMITSLDDINKILSQLDKAHGRKLIIFNIKDEANERRIESTLKGKKLTFAIINTETRDGLEELKEKIFQCFGKIRVSTKEPGKLKSDNPLILNPGSTVNDVAKKIFHNSSIIKETRIWGPSSKFPGQIVGLQHELKDLDVVEFRTR